MLFFLLSPWILISLFLASPLPDPFRARSSNVSGGAAFFA
jgi:hypothetical protein